MRYILLLATLMLLVLAVGCTTQTPPSTDSTEAQVTLTTIQTPTPATHQTTMPATPTQTIELTIHSILLGWVSDNQFSVPPAGYQFVLVDFSIMNVGHPNGYNYNPYNVKLRDPDNYQYSYDSASYGVPGSFGMTTIPYGETRRGKLVFPVPASHGAGTTYWLEVK